MNCQDIGRILDSGKFGALSASERRDAEAHAHTCRHCAPRWGVHSRMAGMSIAPMPKEFAQHVQSLVAARARSNVIRFVPRTLIIASGFVVLAAAAAVATVKYSSLVRHREVATIPVEVVAPAQAVQAAPVLPPAPPPAAPFIPPAAPPAAQPPAADAPARVLASGAVPQSSQSIQQTAQGETDMNRTSSIAVAIAAVGVAAAAPAQNAGQTTIEQIIASNDLNKDGYVTKQEATTANKTMIKMWGFYDMDSDGRVDAKEAARASEAMYVATAEEKITGEKSSAGPAMVKPSDAIATNDLNKDGVVTKEEAMTVGKGMARLWDAYDLNKDGKIDVVEFGKAQGY
jgi:Ca2+-binding EF-hand superfamily protein